MRTFLDIIFIVYCWGSVVIYEKIIMTFSPAIYETFGMSEELANSEKMKWITIVTLNILMLPVVLKRNLSALAHFNFLGILAIGYVIILLICQGPEMMDYYFNIEDVIWGRFTINAFQGYALSVFAFSCHTNIFIIHRERRNAVQRRMKKVCFHSLQEAFANLHRSSAEQFLGTSRST